MCSRLILTLTPVILGLVTSVAHAGACDRGEQQYLNSVHRVDSLRPEKPGQMRVFSPDGSEFNAGQVQWMKARLRKLDELCARGTPDDEVEATKLLQDVRELLDSHKRHA